MEWTGAEILKEVPAHEENPEEEEEGDYVAPIEGCTGIVMDNLNENMTVEDIKTILKKGRSGGTLKSWSIHPTGSLRSKIVEFPDADLIPFQPSGLGLFPLINTIMIDTNAYRKRIGTFSQPGQRKFKTNNLSNYRKQK